MSREPYSHNEIIDKMMHLTGRKNDAQLSIMFGVDRGTAYRFRNKTRVEFTDYMITFLIDELKKCGKEYSLTEQEW